MRTLKVLIDGLAFPEGPRWHDGRFFFSDMHAHQVVAVDMAGKREGHLRGAESAVGAWMVAGWADARGVDDGSEVDAS